MKILSLKFKNINSLSGENQIDFTDPVFSNEGLFAITGKTGAGKSSILDAISLALFGKTPRVEITGIENAVMTRGEKDCYADIVFEVAGKKWKSSWKQELRRTGTLKPVNRVIADASDTIVADQVRTCDTKIVEILGLTFDQFTKVILLAQGSFAAFLQADKNDKGELLEQITGTEIYGEISRKVFERNRLEHQKLDNILLELGQIKILSDEEMEQINLEISFCEEKKLIVDREFKELQHAKNWVTELENLQIQIADTQKKIPELEEKVTVGKTALELAEERLKTAKTELEKHNPIFVKVRELDTKIIEKANALRPILTGIADLEKSKNEWIQTLLTLNGDIEKSQQLLLRKQEWAATHRHFETLIAHYAAIEHEHLQLNRVATEIQNQTSACALLQQGVELKKLNFETANELFKSKAQLLIEKNQELEAKKSALTNIFGEKELFTYQSEKENIVAFNTHIKNLIDIENAMASRTLEIEHYQTLIADAELEATQLTQNSTELKKQKERLEEHLILLDENIKLAKTIQSLEEHRSHLKDGEACPLCGALEHPYALGNTPQIGEKEQELQTLKVQLQEITTRFLEMEKKVTKVLADKNNWMANLLKEDNILAENRKKQLLFIQELTQLQPNFTIAEEEHKLALLEEIYRQKQKELLDIEIIISKGLTLEKSIKIVQDHEIPALQKEKDGLEKSKNEADTAFKLAEQELRNTMGLLALTQTKHTSENAIFIQKLEQYGVNTIEALKKCLEDWNNNKKEMEELGHQIATLNTSITLTNNKLEDNKTQIDLKSKEQLAAETEKQQLENERAQIFADKLVELEEKRLKQWVENGETSKSIIEKEHTEATIELAKSVAVLSEKEKELAEKREWNLTEKSIEELQVILEDTKSLADELSQKMGAYHQELKMNGEKIKTSGYKLKEKEKQQQICNKWGALSELIGSSDGKKYRNFAQALTFEHLISLSNGQLRKMSDRYILKRTGDTTNPFELSVIDKFQNSEERTAQNLSGGEKFIVSLSLALGLSNMASKNMSIDTMFIDEGFGTLDSDYLDVALSALSNLQHEGKLIGVISHLAELKERIATHIEVIPSGNGHSYIKVVH